MQAQGLLCKLLPLLMGLPNIDIGYIRSSAEGSDTAIDGAMLTSDLNLNPGRHTIFMHRRSLNFIGMKGQKTGERFLQAPAM